MIIFEERKSLTSGESVKAMEVDFPRREVTAYFATWDLDRIGDTIDEKAFDKTFAERGPRYSGAKSDDSFLGSKIKVDFNHECIIGVVTDLGKDATGAWYTGRIDKTQLGDDTMERLRNKSLDVNSFQYDVMDWDPVSSSKSVKIEGGYEVVHNRHLKELRLHFCGPVDAACNEAAGMISVKNLKDIAKFSQQDLGTWLDALIWRHSTELKAGRKLSTASIALLDAAITALSELRLMAGKPEEPEPESPADSEDESLDEDELKSAPEPQPPDNQSDGTKANNEQKALEMIRGLRSFLKGN